MTTFWIDGDKPDDTGDGLTFATAWKNASHAVAQTGDGHIFNWSGDFRGQTPGTNGLFEINGNSWTFQWSAGTRPTIGWSAGADVSILTSVLAAGTATIVTSSSHGFTSNQTVLIAGVTGTTSTVNGNRLITVTNATTFTFALAGTGSEGAVGTVSFAASEKACIYNGGFTGSSMTDATLTRGRYGVRMASTYTGVSGVRLNATLMGSYAFSHSGASTSSSWFACTATYCREDAWNYSGTSNTGGTIESCTGSYIGYDFDGVVTSDISGAGDFVTTHPGSGSSNSVDVKGCTASFCFQGAVTNTNTLGTSRVWNCFFYEISGSAVVQNGGGSMQCWNNFIIAPVNAALDATSVHSCFRFNPSNSVGGTFEVYHNTVYTARGAIGTVGTAYFGASVAGTNIAATSIFTNNRVIGNGTAPFWHIANTTAVNNSDVTIGGSSTTITSASPHGLLAGQKVLLASITGGAAAANGTHRVVTVPDTTHFTIALTGSGNSTNGTSAKTPDVTVDYTAYSGLSSVSMFSYGGTKSGATWQTHGFDANAVFSSGIRTTPPTTAYHMRVSPSSLALTGGDDLAGGGIAEIVVDYFGHARPTSPTFGAHQSASGGLGGGAGVGGAMMLLLDG